MILDRRIQSSGLLGIRHSLLPAVTLGIAQTKRVQATCGQFFQTSHTCPLEGTLGMEQGSLRLPGMDCHLSHVPLRLCQHHQIAARFGNPPCLLQQRLCCGQVEGLLSCQDRQAVEDGTLHHQLTCLPCVREHRGIGRSSLLPLSVQFIRPPQVAVEMLDLRRRKHGQEAEPMHSLSHKMLCLLVEGEGIAHGYQPHGLIACGDTPVEGWFCKSRSQGMVGQLRRRCCRRLQRLQRTAMKDGAPRFTRLSVDDRTDLLMGEYVAPSSHGPSLALRLIQQAAVQNLVQGRKSVLF